MARNACYVFTAIENGDLSFVTSSFEPCVFCYKIRKKGGWMAGGQLMRRQGCVSIFGSFGLGGDPGRCVDCFGRKLDLVYCSMLE